MISLTKHASWRAAGALIAVMTTTAVAAPAAAQDAAFDARVEQVTHLRAADARTFFVRLRTALGLGEKADVCALLSYPLAQPSGAIKDAAECVKKYDDIFTVPVRRAVGKAQFESLFPTDTGLVVGFGEVWIGGCAGSGCADGGPRVTQVNGVGGRPLRPPKGKILVACAAPAAQVRVVADGVGGATLALWPERGGDPTALTRPPADGAPPDGPPAQTYPSQPISSSGPPECAYRNWTFGDDSVTYSVVTDLGCLALKDGVPPMGSVAQVVRITPGKGRETLWCTE